MFKIKSKNFEDIYALTPMQEGMLFHYLKNPDCEYYFEQLFLEITGDINIKNFEKAWNFVIKTNEMLRTVFRWDKFKNPMQIVLKNHKLQPQYYDFSERSATDAQAMLEEIKVKEQEQKFDLYDVPFRITLCKKKINKYEMIVSYHHILYDGWSSGIILKEFFEAYTKLCFAPANKLTKPVKTRFKEFLKWLKQQDKYQQKNFWSQYLLNFDTPTFFNLKSREIINEAKNLYITLEKNTIDLLDKFITSNRLTQASVFYGAWGLLMQRYCNSTDVVFGITVSGRPPAIKGIENIVGLFINTLPLRIRTYNSIRLLEFLFQLDRNLQGQKGYDQTSLVEINQCSAIPGGRLFNTLFVIENYPIDPLLTSFNKTLTITSYSAIEKTHYDLEVILELSKKIKITFKSLPGIITEEKMQLLAGHYREIIDKIIANPLQLVSQLEIISEHEKKQILHDFNSTAASYPNDKKIHHLFEEQSKRKPDNIVLIGENPKFQIQDVTIKRHIDSRNTSNIISSKEKKQWQMNVTYKELNEISNSIAKLLLEEAVLPNTIVGIMIERSVEMITGIFAILKAGFAYMPIDPTYPRERIDYMLKDSGAKILLRDQEIAEFYSRYKYILSPNKSSFHLPRTSHSDTSLIYVIYTSGTTGKPKGAGVCHTGFLNLIHWFVTAFALNNRDRNLLLTSLSFDLTQKNIFAPLVTGGVLSFPSLNYFDPADIIRCIEERSLTWFNCTPGMIYKIIDFSHEKDLKKIFSLRYIFLGGEPISLKVMGKWVKSELFNAQIINTYGPTECTDICASYSIVEPGTYQEKNIPIGTPIYNVNLYVLDRWNQFSPVGVSGELLIGGDGIGLGYINCPELTAEKFIKSIYIGQKTQESEKQEKNLFHNRQQQKVLHHKSKPNRILYKTGDLVCWLPDGNIEFIGRVDHQVKIRGFRIELGEIENCLLKLNGIKETVIVVWKEERRDNYICAYFVSDNKYQIKELREYLSEKLPDYMIPSHFVQLEKLPLTPHGKVNRRVLPKPELQFDEAYQAPRNKIEKKLAKIWSEILGIEKEKIGINDNFFHLGGHSLKATQLVSHIHKELNVKIPLPEIFKNSHLQEQASFIKNSRTQQMFSIEPVERKEFFLLSSAQRRLFVLQQLDEKGIAYNMQSVWQLKGELCRDKFKSIIQQLIHRHESLRTSFHLVNDEPVQKVHAEFTFEINFHPIATNKINSVLSSLIRPFDLSKAPLLRVVILKEKRKEDWLDSSFVNHFLLVDMHHIISDGISIGILVQEFMKLYAGQDLPELKLQYKDYSNWLYSNDIHRLIKEQETYWLKEFFGEPPILELPTNNPRPRIQNFSGKSISFELSQEDTITLKTTANEKGVTLFMLLLSIYFVYLSKLCNQEDIVVGTPLAGRRHIDLEGIMGMFVNTLALRNFPHKQKTFSQFLNEVKANTLNAFENQDYLYEDLVEKIIVKRDTGRNPLFDTLFALQNMDIAEIEIPGLQISPYPFDNNTSKFDTSLTGIEKQNKLFFIYTYNTKLFTRKTIKKFIDYFKILISDILKKGKSKIKLSELEIITPQEKKQVLLTFNNTEFDIQTDKTIHQLFAERVVLYPYHVAIVGDSVINKFQKNIPLPFTENCALTYKELNNQSNRLSLTLSNMGISQDMTVGILVNRSIEMITGLLGILKASGAYLPIDEKYPEDRKRFILKESGATILLTSEKIVENSQKKTFANVYSPELNSAMMSLAYVLYTSGSTGRPKGVMVRHRNVVNLVYAVKELVFQQDNHLPVALVSPIYFDASIKQIFPTLIFGHRLIIATEQERIDGEQLLGLYSRQHIVVTDGTPAHLELILQNISILLKNDTLSVSKFVIGGDVLNQPLVKKFFTSINETIDGKTIRILNVYGPTECCDVSSTFSITKNKVTQLSTIPIGKPIINTTIYILNIAFALQPSGIAGEMYIGGNGVSRGYLNQPELTSERFCPNFIQLDRNFNPNKTYYSILYRTGDLSSWLPDGNLEFLGRIDDQVKIRGFRIELGEIEGYILRIKDIQKVVVLAWEDSKRDKYLCAYYVSQNSYRMDTLRENLSKKLPDYMIPSFFKQVEKIPLTPSGKVDRRSLPKPELQYHEGVLAPQNNIERKLVEIWSDVLDIEKEKIGIKDNFFYLGGHSLRVMQLVSRIHKEFNVKIPLPEIFKRSYIREQANYIKNSQAKQFITIKPIEKREFYPLSSAQRRLYVLQQLDETKIAYNIPSVWQLKGKIETEKLQKAFQQLICRHESLRTSFQTVNGTQVQAVFDELNFKIDSHSIDSNQTIPPYNSFVRPFELSKPPLFRVFILECKETEMRKEVSTGHTILIIDMHHIITDGMSVRVLIRELIDIYMGKTQAALKLQYRDYCQWQKLRRGENPIKEQETYWLNEFSGEIPVLDLPLDYPKQSVHNFSGSRIFFEVNSETTHELKSLALRNDVTLFMLLLSIYNVFLSKLCGQIDLVVGTPVASRRHAEVESIIGMFVNTLPLRNHPHSQLPFIHFLKKVKQNTINAFENQDYLYEDLVDQVNVERNTGGNPLFDTMIVLRDSLVSKLNIPKLSINPIQYESPISKFDLTLSILENAKGMNFTFEYCTTLFKKNTIHRYIGYFSKTLFSIILNPCIKISDIEIIDQKEKNQILYEFNNTYANFPKNKMIHRLFEEQVEKTPNHVAVVGQGIICRAQENSQHTLPARNCYIAYNELNNQSNRLATNLVTKGVIADTIVAIMVDRSVEMITGLFGILKAGGAYLPIDKIFPDKRKQYILKESGCKIVLTDQDFANITLKKEIQSDSKLYFQAISHHPLAYVLYTSGSTGEPKGVMVTHKNVVNLVYGMKEIIFRNKTPVPIGMVSPLYFDASVKQIFPTLLLGHQLIIVPEHMRMDGENLILFYIKHRILVSDGTPTHLELILSAPTYQLFTNQVSILKFVIGGEVLNTSIVENFFNGIKKISDRNKAEIINVYGPTECCDVTSSFTVSSSSLEQYRTVPIGKPINNVNIYIMNNTGSIQPIGIVGEIYIGGLGVARGYLNQPELTDNKLFRLDLWKCQNSYNRKFIEGSEPFSKKKVTRQRRKIYRTGDLARWSLDGNIEFIGRIDNQIKIRGFRIEPGEIEKQLLQIDKIQQAVVLIRGESEEEKYICAYYVSDRIYDASVLIANLSEVLPNYMMPRYFEQLKQIPLTPNGKVDKKALPIPENRINKSYIAPKNEIEVILVKIWSDILGIETEKISINDNFFHLGGHSLKATILISRIRKEFNVNIPITHIFKHPNISELTTIIKNAETKVFFSMKAVEKKKYYPLSSAQKRIFVLHQMDKRGITYNMPSMWQLEGEIDRKKFRLIFRQLLLRHESLRTSFRLVNNEPVQVVHDETGLEFEFNTNEYLPKSEKTNLEKDTTLENNFIKKNQISNYIKHLVKPFNLAKAPLMSIVFLDHQWKQTNCKNHHNHITLLLDFHHIISDGISSEILINDFISLYKNKALLPLRIQYKDFAEWQNSEDGRKSLIRQESYWIKEFSEDIPFINLPLDYERPESIGFEGNSVTFTIDHVLFEQIKNRAIQLNVTHMMFLLSVYFILLSKYALKDDIIVGTVIAGRQHTDIENIMGFFVNMLAIRTQPEQYKQFTEYLAEVKRKTLEAFENQSYQFDELVNKLGIQRQQNRHPLVDVVFVYTDILQHSINSSKLTFNCIDISSRNVSHFDLMFHVFNKKDSFTFKIEYSTSLFKQQTIEKLSKLYSEILEQIMENENIRLEEINSNHEFVTVETNILRNKELDFDF